MLPIKTAFFAVALMFGSGAIAQAPVAAPAPVVQDAAVAPATPGITMSAPVADVGQPKAEGIYFQDQVTPRGRQALWFHNYFLMPLIVGISVLVLLLLLWTSFRYRRSANPTPSKVSHNTTIEVVWTLAPVFLLLAIVWPSVSLLHAEFAPPGKNAITIKAIGAQWYWTYEYPDNGGFEIVSNMLPDAEAKKRGEPRLLAVDNRIVVPVGIPIRLQTTSQDVIHAWSVPAFWTQMDAVPGRINEASFTVEKPGVYYGQCYNICGARHGFMPIAVEAVSPAKFAQWVASKGGVPKGAKPALPAGVNALPAVPAATPAPKA